MPHKLDAALARAVAVNGGYVIGTKHVGRFGITKDDYAGMVVAQGSKCAICGTFHEYAAALAVDHCHSTGKVRGLLCRSCNTALGFLKDDVALLRAAIDYLERNQ